MNYKTVFSSVAFALALPTLSVASVIDKYSISAPLAMDSEKIIFSKIFDIELWSNTYPEDYNQDTTIRILMAARVDKSEIIEFVLDEAVEINDIPDTEIDAMYSTLDSALDCLPTADTVLDFNLVPGVGIQVSCDGAMGAIAVTNKQHVVYLMDVFLHPESEYTGLAKP